MSDTKEIAMRRRNEGKEMVRGLTVWKLEMGDVSLRCVRQTQNGLFKRYVVQVKMVTIHRWSTIAIGVDHAQLLRKSVDVLLTPPDDEGAAESGP